MTAIILFLLWTLLIYWMHRLAHVLPVMSHFHMDHHRQVTDETITGLHWKNVFLWFDTFESTADQWLTEVIPTILFAWITGHWWIAAFYYVWAAFIQEAIEHNPKFNLYPFLTSGKWHLIHHEDPDKNYGVFFPIWDMMFGTYKEK
jgi:sterol desaturase/sphingolipid hydroxylase (fatty acid hydroxylase superfamily)